MKLRVLDAFRLLAPRKIGKKMMAAAIPAQPWTMLRIDGTVGAEASQMATATNKHGKKILYLQRQGLVVVSFMFIQPTVSRRKFFGGGNS